MSIANNKIMNDNGPIKPTLRRPVILSGAALFIMSFQTLGTIYSDIGTSPLYVLNGIWPATGPTPGREDVIGGVSAIVWAITLLPLIKYIFISMRFGTKEGEGGTFALFTGLFPPPAYDEDDRSLTGDSFTAKSNRSGIRGSQALKKVKWPLLLWTLFGTSLTMSDGIFTPAVSVTSAVAGIAVAKPSVIHQITPISIAILVLLFLVQRFGTARLTYVFAPVTFGWLALLGATGIYNITKFPGIFRAFDPSRAIMLFVRTKDYDLLAGVLLAITGCEAMFANLGQFNAASIQLTFSLFVYPCLVLAYLGQGARLVQDGDAVMSNIFYQTIPGETNGPLYWIMFIFAVLATIIASQALITATFSLVQQIVNLKSLPPFELVYTSDTIQGQVYVPTANYLLGIATIIVVAVFKDLANLTNAYGFAVATVMIVTTTLIAVQIFAIKRLPLILACAFFLAFGFLDGLFWGASLKKVPHGAWVPLSIGSILTGIMYFWTWAKGLEDDFDGKNRKNLRHFIINSSANGKNAKESDTLEAGATDDLSTEFEGVTELPRESASVEEDRGVPTSLVFVEDGTRSQTNLSRLPTCAVFHKFASGKGVPHSFYAFVKQWPALPRVVIFLSVRLVPIAHVPYHERYSVNRVRSISGFYGVEYALGFRDDFEAVTDEIINQICDLEARADPKNARAIVAEIRSVALNSTHIVPHYHVISKHVPHAGFLTPVVRWVRSFLIEQVYGRLSIMFPETANWVGNTEEIIRVGVSAAI